MARGSLRDQAKIPVSPRHRAIWLEPVWNGRDPKKGSCSKLLLHTLKRKRSHPPCGATRAPPPPLQQAVSSGGEPGEHTEDPLWKPRPIRALHGPPLERGGGG